MAEINVAYSTLTDTTKRLRYEQTGDCYNTSTEEKDLEAAVVSLFLALLETANHCDYDMKVSMRESLLKVRQALSVTAFDVRNKLRHFQIARIKIRSKNPIFFKALDERITDLQLNISKTEYEMEVTARAIKFLESNFDWDNEIA